MPSETAAASSAPPGVIEAIGAELRATRIPGGSIAVVRRDGLAWAAGVGLASIHAERPASPDTVYHLYSGTKLYTAAAVMTLVEAGKVSLDTPAADYLPDVLGQLDKCRPTVRQLLSHTSGLRDTMRGFIAVHGAGTPAPTTAQALARYRIACERAPGEPATYRNVNFAILGELVSRVAGEPYTAYATRAVLQPLGMAAAYAATPAMVAAMAAGYLGRWDLLRFAAPFLVPGLSGKLFARRSDGYMELVPFDLDTAAIGGLVGSVLAFVPFVEEQLRGGGRALSEASVRAMQTLGARGAAGIASRVGTGLGWKFGEVEGVTFLNHEGGGPGFTSETRLYPEAGLGMVLCLNRWMMPKQTHLAAHRICEVVRLASG